MLRQLYRLIDIIVIGEYVTDSGDNVKRTDWSADALPEGFGAIIEADAQLASMMDQFERGTSRLYTRLRK